MWEEIKTRCLAKQAIVTVVGFNRWSPSKALSVGHCRIRTSADKVGAPLFYREVNLPFIDTVKDESVFVPKPGLDFSQLFFPVKGILCIYDRQTGVFQSLPGADDPNLVQSNPAWSPDGRYIVFAATKAHTIRGVTGTRKVLLSPAERPRSDCLTVSRSYVLILLPSAFAGGRKIWYNLSTARVTCRITECEVQQAMTGIGWEVLMALLEVLTSGAMVIWLAGATSAQPAVSTSPAIAPADAKAFEQVKRIRRCVNKALIP